jgi:hypothetical protein
MGMGRENLGPVSLRLRSSFPYYIICNLGSSFPRAFHTILGVILIPKQLNEIGLRAGFCSTLHTILGAILPPKLFSETGPRILGSNLLNRLPWAIWVM